jgi:glyoxylate reductase
MARVVVTQPVQPEPLERLRAAGHEVVELNNPGGLPAAQLADACAGADALLSQLTDQVGAEVFAVDGLKLVATIAVGFDNVDVPAAKARNVIVTNTPDVLTNATADLAMALMLAVARHIPESDAEVRSPVDKPFGLLREPMGIDISGARLGVVGLGRIGAAVAQRAHFGFGMEIVYSGRRLNEEAQQRFGARFLPLDELLAASDVVTLHAPLTSETTHLINKNTLAQMQPHAILVNTGRGGLVSEVDLAAALQAGQLAGAGLDVFEHEPDVHPDLLACGPRVVLTPHVGSATTKTRLAMTTLAVDNVLAVLAGDAPLTPVTGPKQ